VNPSSVSASTTPSSHVRFSDLALVPHKDRRGSTRKRSEVKKSIFKRRSDVEHLQGRFTLSFVSDVVGFVKQMGFQ